MTLIAAIFVLTLELYLQNTGQYRQLDWFSAWQDKLAEWFGESFVYQTRFGLALILLTIPLLLLVSIALLDGFFQAMVLLVLSCYILFISIGPQSLKQSFEPYFEALQRQDEEAAFLALQQASNSEDVPESDDLIRNATRVILVESQSRYFGVIFWFVVLGVFGALFYRLCHLYRTSCKQEANEDHFPVVDDLVYWLDWLPARLTGFLFLMLGDFVKGFYRLKDYVLDTEVSNAQVISETGVSALGVELGLSDNNPDENKNAIALVERTVIFYLILVAVLQLGFGL